MVRGMLRGIVLGMLRVNVWGGVVVPPKESTIMTVGQWGEAATSPGVQPTRRNNVAATKTRNRRSSTPQERAEKQEGRVAELKETFDAAVSELAGSDAWREMLNGAVHFHRYSFRNMMLILQQCPHASQVAGYREWQKRGRQVRGGERAIWILAPMTARAQETESAPGSDEPSEDDNNRPRVFYRPVKVFDVSQTDRMDGKPDPVSVPRLTGDAPAQMWDQLAQYTETLGYALERRSTAPANGYTEPATRTVHVSDELENAHATKTLGHEVAHIVCEHVADYEEYKRHRGRMETEAESVAYIVAGVFGMDSAAVSVPYVAGWAGNTPEEVRDTIKAAGNRVMTAARTILAAVAPTGDTEAQPKH
ncbi:ArdC family protein [Streptomyces sp. NPDC001970]